jgi:lipoteichoic acid synthase
MEFKERRIHLTDNHYSKECLEYLEKANYMDYYLGKFIEHLKKTDKFNNTLIIIAADHHIPHNMIHADVKETIPLYVLNSGIYLFPKNNIKIKQCDIFPTLLDIMKIRAKWRGV